MTKYINFVTTEKHQSQEKISSLKPTRAQVWGLPPNGARAMTLWEMKL
jgi:hypothetical protein